MDTLPAFALARQAVAAGPVATRMAAFDTAFLGMLLPNPDPLLRQTGQQVQAYREIARDSHVGACIRRRKSAVKALQWELDRGEAPARVHTAIRAMLDALDVERIIGQILDATLYGYQPLEIDWQAGPGGWRAADVQAKPPEWFCFDVEANLRFRSRSAPVYGEPVPERKFLLPRQDASYENPYGYGDMALCWWPVQFKKGGLRFWLEFAEKYGSAFAVGKLPRGAEAAERSKLLDDLAELARSGAAVIPDDGSVDLLELAGKSASADLYERLVMYCRGEISIVLTGTNQTVEATSNKASAHAGQDVADALRDGDAEIVTAAMNELIAWTCELNWPAATPPRFTMWDQQAKDELQSSREKNNFDAGARFTKSYWMRQYGYLETDLAETSPLPHGPVDGGAARVVPPAAFAAGDEAQDPLAAETDQLARAAQPRWDAMLGQLRRLVERAVDLDALQRELLDAFGGLDSAELTRIMAAAFALAELKGMAEVVDGQ